MSVALQDRLAGAVWGHLVGDAMGVPYEFKPSPPTVEWGHAGTWGQPPGTWSDDGALMLALLDSLLSVGFDPEDQARRSVRWFRNSEYAPGPRFDIGNATRAALARFEAGSAAGESGGVAEASNGNGSLMRILPVALLGRDLDSVHLADWARRASSVTHAHPRSRACCIAYCLLIQDALRGERPDLASALVATRRVADSTELAELDQIESFSTRSGDGYVVDCLWSAWDAFDGAPDYAATIERAIKYGNDTDTTAAVAGGLAGAWFGAAAIPPAWLTAMRGRPIADALVTRLVAVE